MSESSCRASAVVTLGRDFRDLGLGEAHIGIYDDQVVATVPTESALHETLPAIMFPGADDHPYIYHYAT